MLFGRWLASPLRRALSRPYVHVLFGARQTGKSTTVLANPGPIFEQWVGIELWKRLQYLGKGRLTYLRSKSGYEIDWIVEDDRTVTPIEVKWTENPAGRDTRHLRAFLDEQGRRAPMGYLVCRCPRPRLLAPKVTALPWWML